MKIKIKSDENYLNLFTQNSKRSPDALLDEADKILENK